LIYGTRKCSWFMYCATSRRVAGSIRGREGNFFSFIHNVHTGCGAQPAAYPVGIGGSLSLGVKRPFGEADHSPPSSAEVKNGGAIPSSPTSSWSGA
jgi:hypothetical protein